MRAGSGRDRRHHRRAHVRAVGSDQHDPPTRTSVSGRYTRTRSGSPSSSRFACSSARATTSTPTTCSPRTTAPWWREKTGEFASGDSPHENNYSNDGKRIFHASIGRVYTPTDRSELGPARDASKGERYFQIVDAETLEILKRWDMGQKLGEAGYPEMDSAVRPMALSPDERYAYLQISFHHGFVEYALELERVLRVANLPISEEARNTPLLGLSQRRRPGRRHRL
jgi:hypothetical protein